MLNCKELTHKIASDRLPDAGPWERFTARLHLLMCSYCRRYERQLRDISSTARQLGTDSSQDRSRVERLERQILDTLSNGTKDPVDRQ
jgi:hypothetical protein